MAGWGGRISGALQTEVIELGSVDTQAQSLPMLWNVL